ncbi:MAG: hypothetical protein AAFR49_03655 [Pseudomonadota bacterium]
MRRSTIAIGLQVTILAVTLLIIVLVHSEMIRISLSHLGLRSDVPQIVFVEDRCEQTFVPAWAFRQGPKHAPFWRSDCERQPDRAQVWHTIPRGQRSVLFVNETKTDIGNSQTQLVRRAEIELRAGGNRVAVLADGAQAAFPFASSNRTPSFVVPNGRIPPGASSSAVNEIWLSRTARLPVIERPGVIGLGNEPGGNLWRLSTGADCIEAHRGEDRAECETKNSENAIDESGYGLVSMERSEQDDLQDLAKDFKRALTIKPLGQTQLEVTFEACLSPRLPLVQHLRDKTVQSKEAIARIFGMEVHALRPFSLTSASPVGVPNELDSEPHICRNFEGAATFPLGSVSFLRGNFLRMDGDTLTISGFGPRLETIPNGKFSDDGQSVTWEGRFGERVDLRITDWGLELSGGGSQGGTGGGIFGSLSQVAKLIPPETQAMLRGLAATLPVLVLLMVVYPRRRFRSFAGSVMALEGLTVFMIVMALQPWLLAASSWVLTSIASLSLSLNIADPLTALSSLTITTKHYAPLAVIAASMMVPIIQMRHAQKLLVRPSKQHLFWQAVLALIFVGIGTSFLWVQSNTSDAIDLVRILAIWFGLTLCYTFILVWRATSSIIGNGRNAVLVALGGACVLVGVPALPAASGAAELIVVLSESIPSHPIFGGLSAPVLAGLLFVQQWLPNLMMVLLLALLISTFLAIARAFLPSGWLVYLPKTWHLLSVTVLAVLIVWPNFQDIAKGLRPFDVATYQIMGLFHDYSVYLALLVPLGILARRTADKPKLRQAPFALDEDADALAAAIFAGYVVIWHAASIGFVWPFLLVSLGYVGMTHLAYSQEGSGGSQASRDQAKLGAKLLHVLEQGALLSERRKAANKKYAGLDGDWATLRAENDEIDRINQELSTSLEISTGQAKRRLLNNGPLSTPFHNALLGAAYGLLMALIIEAGSALDLDSLLDGNSGWWRPLIELTLSAQSGTLGGPVRPLDNEILSLVSALLRSLTHWPIVGFVFGLVFHRLRGDDGFTKGLVFAGLLVLLMTLGRFGSGTVDLIPGGAQAFLGSMLLIVTFVVLMGTVGFDLFTIYENDLPFKSITQIYGVATLFSYATLLTGLTALQSTSALIASFLGSN